ncbi:Pattern recognition serine proteinase [Operophtera brumata]|uniref:Pattern recognition serine proteinase n=1 Tax=Operophtera brumata TaxID=104452 RepID=A0A0L7KXT4_OPEBR|nr:Pattern recognition serine proteinase [Operophtera brumata]
MVSPAGEVTVAGGERVKRGEFPWHAGIYKNITTYQQVCGGSLINNRVVISAAHCFWTDLEKQLPASQFAVAVGKLYRPWGDPVDQAQTSDVKEVHLPSHFQGAETNYQADIALVIVASQFQFNMHIRPVCLDFDFIFESQQLRSGNRGKLPFVEVGTCYINSPGDFRPFITIDKLCAGTLQSNTAVCKGDSGGGLVFPESYRGTERYYLRGVASTAPKSNDACNTAAYTTFTQLMKHEHFIKQFWIES